MNQIGQNFDNLLAVLYSIFLPISIKVKVLRTNSKTKFSQPKLFCLLIFFYFYFSPWYVYMPILPCGALNVPILKQAPCSGCHKIHSPSFPPSTLGLFFSLVEILPLLFFLVFSLPLLLLFVHIFSLVLHFCKKTASRLTSRSL